MFESLLFLLPAVKSLRGCQHDGLWGSRPLIPRQQRGHSVVRFMRWRTAKTLKYKTLRQTINSCYLALWAIFVSLISSFLILLKVSNRRVNRFCGQELSVYEHVHRVMHAIITNTDLCFFTGDSVWKSQFYFGNHVVTLCFPCNALICSVHHELLCKAMHDHFSWYSGRVSRRQDTMRTIVQGWRWMKTNGCYLYQQRIW